MDSNKGCVDLCQDWCCSLLHADAIFKVAFYLLVVPDPHGLVFFWDFIKHMPVLFIVEVALQYFLFHSDELVSALTPVT